MKSRAKLSLEGARQSQQLLGIAARAGSLSAFRTFCTFHCFTFGESFNGRTGAFGALNPGSNPGSPASPVPNLRLEADLAVHVRVAVPYHVVYYAPFFVAQHQGFFRQEGITVEAQIAGPVTPLVAMASGDVDVGVGGIMRSLVAYDRGESAVPMHFARINDRDGFFLLGPKQEFDWADLIDKRLIVFGEAPTPWYVLRSLLLQKGLDPDRIRAFEDVPLAAASAVYRAGGADYLLTQAHVAEELLQQSEAFLVRAMAHEAGPLPYSSYYASSGFLEREQALVAGFVRAHVAALAWMRQSTGAEIWDAIAPAFKDGNPDVLRRATQRYKELGTWSSDATLSPSTYGRLTDALSRGGLIERIAPYELVIRDQVAAELTAASGSA